MVWFKRTIFLTNKESIILSKCLIKPFVDDWSTTKGWYDVDNYPLHVSAERFSMMTYQLTIVDCLNC